MMLDSIFKPAVDFYMANINYFTITLLMTVESSFIPFPSEVVIPPAAWKAAAGELNIFLVIFFGTLGAIFGALINYFLAISLGRKIIYALADTKFMHAMMIDRQSVEKAEAYFIKYGNLSTLIGRLVTVVRQLISIPAGLARMKISDFLLYTTIGAAIWNSLLAMLGYFLYGQKDLIDKYYNEISYSVIVLGVLFFGYVVFKFIKSNKQTKKAN